MSWWRRIERKTWRPGWTYASRHLHVDINLDMVNIPRLHLDPARRYIAISWGNGLSDPVFLVELNRG